MVAATLAIVAIYIAFTRTVTDWRTKLQREMNEVDNRAIGRAVDSLLNYETVKYFGAEEREARRYDDAIAAFARAARAMRSRSPGSTSASRRSPI